MRVLSIGRGRTEAWKTDYNEKLPYDTLGDLTQVEYRKLHNSETNKLCVTLIWTGLQDIYNDGNVERVSSPSGIWRKADLIGASLLIFP
jgi:hypothetical protein